MRIALCDPDVLCAADVKKLIYKYANMHKLEIVIDEFYSGKALLCSNIKYTLLLIEYNMKDMSGLDTARLLRSRGFKGTIIFYSSRTDSILQSFTVNPYRFFLKPLSEKEVFPDLDEFFSSYNTDHPLWIKNGDDISCLNTGDIFYLEAANKHCYVNLVSEKLLCRKTMARVSALLPVSHFFRINRAYIVNFYHIISYNKEYLTLKNGEKLRISRNYYKAFKEEYRSFANPFIP